MATIKYLNLDGVSRLVEKMKQWVTTQGYITASDVPTELPTVGTSDAGKILCVDDSGAWVATSIAMQRYYTGSSEPAAAQGEDGDLYLQTEEESE